MLIDGRDARDCPLDLAARPGRRRAPGHRAVHRQRARQHRLRHRRDAASEIVDAAKAAAAHEFIERLPDGYDTELGPQGAGLSGGQRQRIGIARTLLRNPPVIVLDEPTTALDRESEEQVLQGLDRLMRGRTCILITHSPRLARTADRDRRARARPRRRDGAKPALPSSSACSTADVARRLLGATTPRDRAASRTRPAGASTSTTAPARPATPCSGSADRARTLARAGPARAATRRPTTPTRTCS